MESSQKQRVLPLLLALLFGGGVAQAAEETSLIAFELKDQFGEVHRAVDFAGKVLVLIGSDKDGSSFNGKWGGAIYEAVKEEPGIELFTTVACADLRGVPFFIKGMVKSKFPQVRDQWVLMDWKGQLAKAYSFEPDSSNIVVFAADGRLMHHAHGRELESATLDEIVAVLRDLLATP